MMKKGIVVLCAFLLVGCAVGEKYLEDPQSILRDPHFTKYEQKRDDLERAYLHKEITYAEYIERRDRMDETYAKEVQERTSIVISPEK